MSFNLALYEVSHLAKTGKIKGFRLNGHPQIFWYDHDKKCFCMRDNIHSKNVIERKNMMEYVSHVFHASGWYPYDGPFEDQKQKTYDTSNNYYRVRTDTSGTWTNSSTGSYPYYSTAS